MSNVVIERIFPVGQDNMNCTHQILLLVLKEGKITLDLTHVIYALSSVFSRPLKRAVVR